MLNAPPIAPVIPITIIYLIIAEITENKLEIPDTVNPESPPRGPINAVPPTVTRSTNKMDDTIVPWTCSPAMWFLVQ